MCCARTEHFTCPNLRAPEKSQFFWLPYEYYVRTNSRKIVWMDFWCWVLLELILFEWELTACMKTTSCLQVVYLLFFDLFRKLGLVSRQIWPDKILVANQNGNLISTMTAHLVTRHITLSLWSLGYFRTSIRSPEN